MIMVVAALWGMTAHAQSAEENILGQWTVKEKGHVIEFVKQGDTYEAVIKKTDEAAYIGKKQITELKYHKKNQFKGGTFYAHRKGKELPCSVKLLEDNQLELTIDLGITSRSQVWTRR